MLPHNHNTLVLS